MPEHDAMRLSWKVAVPVLCVAMIAGAAILWWVYKTKADERKLAEEAQACRARAEQGDAKAEQDLANMYYYGRGEPQSYADAFQWCRRAADQGYARAEYDLAHLYLQGEGVPKDAAEALRWFRKAADQGDARAEYGMGFIYHEGRGAQQDYAEAVRWYRKAADQGNALAEYELGYMYHHGDGVSQDYAEAARWYRKAADQGDAHAEAGIGFLYYYGYGVPQDRAEGRRWIRKAADQGEDYALRIVSAKLTGWRRFDLLFRLIAGILMTMGFLQPGKDRWSLRSRIAPLTGLLCLVSAGLSWYGYTHYKIRYWTYGPNAFTLFRWLLNGVVIVLLIYVVRTFNTPAQPQCETAVPETDADSRGHTEP
ncbi:MAG: tetratricopeptide repeat protein [Terracidiphilus sp.]